MKTYRIYASHQVYYVKEVQAETWEDARLQGWENDTGDVLTGLVTWFKLQILAGISAGSIQETCTVQTQRRKSTK